jgi:4-amino-4-deoxy-L-arabinose transferase-like glycosyltransferase
MLNQEHDTIPATRRTSPMELIRRYLTDRDGRPGRDLAVLAISCGAAFFMLLGRLPLMDPDEGRYAEIPREMLELGDYITPHLNYVKYFEKPPLLYWMNALSFRVFGLNEFAARFFCALCGLLTVLLVYHAGRKLFDRRSGLLAALTLGTSAGFVAQSRVVLTDIPLTLFITAAFLFFLIASRDDEPRKGLYWYLFYGAAALAMLSKGLIGIVLPGGVAFFYLLFSGRWRLLREMRLFTGILLFLLICAPWFIAVSLKNPEFPHFFFIREHFQRFTSKIHHRYQPLWYFIPVLLGCLLPWTLFLPTTLRRFWRERRSHGSDERLYLLVWAGLVFAFFSVSDSKLIPYILPVLPALALLVGERLSAALDGPADTLRATALATAGLLVPAGAGAVLYPHVAGRPGISTVAATVLGTIIVIQGASAFTAARRRSAAFLVTTLVAGAWLFSLVGPSLVFTTIIARKDSRELAGIAARLAENGATLANFGSYDPGLIFYTGRRIIQIGDPGELEFGSQQGDQSAWFVGGEQFRQRWNSSEQVVVLARKSQVNGFHQLMGSPGIVLGESIQKVLLANRRR